VRHRAVCCRRRVVRHTAHIAVYQSLSVRAVASHYVTSAADTADTCPLNSVVIALEVENVNTVSCICFIVLQPSLFLVSISRVIGQGWFVY